MINSSWLKTGSHDRRDVWKAELLRWCRYDGEFEMPTIPVCDTLPQKLTAFTKADIANADNSFIHFFMDDYKFERVWNKPKRFLPLVQAYGGAIAPDFSLYREMPLVQQMFSVFKSRVMGYWWSRNGVSVIPNVRWGDARTHKFCFDGIPKASVVAIGTHGCVKHRDDRAHFFNGFMAMLECLEPRGIVIYGSASSRIIPPLFVGNVEIVQFESDFSRSRKKEDV